MTVNAKHHPLALFRYCPRCASADFTPRDTKAKQCGNCGFVYYFNPSAAVACFIADNEGTLLVARRGKEPAKGTLDLVGGFVDSFETGEQAALREIGEETGLRPTSVEYLFSLPNIYPYSGFEVHTLDMFFLCRVEDLSTARAADDVSELITISREELQPELFGLQSVKQAVQIFKEKEKK